MVNGNRAWSAGRGNTNRIAHGFHPAFVGSARIDMNFVLVDAPAAGD
jgi:hypothetical protein